jgi:hypothetical protein
VNLELANKSKKSDDIMRLMKTIALVAGIYLASFIAEVIMVTASPEYEGGLSVLVILGLLAFIAPKVGYRWFDCLFAAIPFYGIFFIFKLAHRVALLPKRDWLEKVG